MSRPPLDDDEDLATIRRRTDAAIAGVQVPAGVPRSAFDMARPRPATRLTQVSFDPSAIKIDHTKPAPVGVVRNSTGWAYAALMERMKEGDSVVLPDKESLGYQTYLRKHGFGTCAQRETPTSRRVWKLAAKPKGGSKGGAS